MTTLQSILDNMSKVRNKDFTYQLIDFVRSRGLYEIIKVSVSTLFTLAAEIEFSIRQDILENENLFVVVHMILINCARTYCLL